MSTGSNPIVSPITLQVLCRQVWRENLHVEARMWESGSLWNWAQDSWLEVASALPLSYKQGFSPGIPPPPPENPVWNPDKHPWETKPPQSSRCIGGTECLSCTPGNHSACVIQTRCSGFDSRRLPVFLTSLYFVQSLNFQQRKQDILSRYELDVIMEREPMLFLADRKIFFWSQTVSFTLSLCLKSAAIMKHPKL